MRIAEVRAFPLSFALPERFQVSLGIGKTVKRDAVLVRVRTSSGLVGWGEAHAARASTAIAELVNTTMRQLITGHDALDIDGVWERVYTHAACEPRHGGGGRTPHAAGENHYTRFDFERVLDDGAITIWQPDLSKTGGVTEALRIARLARTCGFRIHPHTSVTGPNMAASLHFLCAIDNAGYFEADFSKYNPFDTALCSPALAIDDQGSLLPPSGPGLGIEIDENLLAEFPVVSGAGYV